MAQTPYYLKGGRSRRRPRMSSLGTPLFVLAILATNYWVFANDATPDAVDIEPGKVLATQTEQPTQPNVPAKAPTKVEKSIDRVPARIVKGSIKKGEIMGRVLVDAGVVPERYQSALTSLDGIVDFRKSRVGDKYRIELNQAGQILSMTYWRNPIEGYVTRVKDDGKVYTAKRLEIPIKKEAMRIGCLVSGSLYNSLVRCVDDSALASKVIHLLSYDLSFYEDVREGDVVRFITERHYVDGRFYRYGPVKALEYNGKFATLRLFHFDDKTPGGAYFKDDGTSLKREFLRSPLQYTRVSSGYQTRRYHPVLHRYKKHLAIDYAAPVGTPVWTVADGKVVFRKRRGPSGNLVTVRHANGYTTRYAHLHRFAKNLKLGDKVQQGDIIGYVGATGRATGPHLHFAMRKGKTHLNPLKFKADPNSSVPDELQEDFSAMIEARLKDLEEIQVESASRRHL